MFKKTGNKLKENIIEAGETYTNIRKVKLNIKRELKGISQDIKLSEIYDKLYKFLKDSIILSILFLILII